MTTKELAEKIYETLFDSFDDENSVEEIERTIKDSPEVVIDYILEQYKEAIL